MSHEPKYILRIGGNPAGQFRTQEDCQNYARSHGGYDHGWSIQNVNDGTIVKSSGVSAVRQTAKIHDDFNDAFFNTAKFIWDSSLFLISGGILLMISVEIIRRLFSGISG